MSFTCHCLFQSQLLCALWSVCCVIELLKLHMVSCVWFCMHTVHDARMMRENLVPSTSFCRELLGNPHCLCPLWLENCPLWCIQAPPLPRMELCFLDTYIGVNAENRCLHECCQIWSGYWFSVTANTAARILCSGLFYEFVPGGNSPLFLLSFLRWETKQCVGLAGSFLACHWYFVGPFHIAFGCLSNWNNLSLPELLLTLYCLLL